MLVAHFASLGCAPGHRSQLASPLPPTNQAEATIRSEYARFVFPTDPAQEYEWDVPGGDAHPGRPDFSWKVTWYPPWDRVGEDPHAVWLVVYWRPGGPHRVHLLRSFEIGGLW